MRNAVTAKPASNVCPRAQPITPRVSVQHHSQVHELGAQTNIRDVCNPELVDRRGLDLACQIRVDRQAVTRVGGDYETAGADAEQIIFPHHPQHALVIHREATLLQLGGDSSIAVCGQLQCGLLHLIADFHLHGCSVARRPPAIEAGAVQSCHLAQSVHGLAFRRGLPDFFKQASPPLTTAGG